MIIGDQTGHTWLPEMNNITTNRVDRTFLHLMAIYAIHGILLHILLKYPQLGSAEINWSVVSIGISNYWNSSIGGRRLNDTKTDVQNISIVITDGITKLCDVDCDCNHVHHGAIMTTELSCQTKLFDAASCSPILSESESSVVKVVTCGITMLRKMRPAVLGIILGCMVFLFTDNINISS